MSNQSGEAWLVRRVADWPHSTFHKLVKAGVYPPEWAGGMADALGYDDWHAAQCAALIAPYALLDDHNGIYGLDWKKNPPRRGQKNSPPHAAGYARVVTQQD